MYIVMKQSTNSIHNNLKLWKSGKTVNGVLSDTAHGYYTRNVVRVYIAGATVILFTLTIKAMQFPSSSSLELGNSKLRFMQLC